MSFIKPDYDIKDEDAITHASNRHIGITEGTKLKKYEFEVVIYVITPITNLIKIIPEIMFLLNAHNPITQMKNQFWLSSVMRMRRKS